LIGKQEEAACNMQPTAAATSFKQGIARLLTIKLCDHNSLPDDKTSARDIKNSYVPAISKGSFVQMKKRPALAAIEIGRRKRELKKERRRVDAT
jgi:hypothetical protein